MFRPLTRVPDHPAIELEILEWWEEHGTFDRAARAEPRRPDLELLRRPGDGEQDGARRPHRVGTHAQGRLPALQGAPGLHQRYQNGFDCQGLWIEVGVERELGLNSKREIEEYGLAEFARRCREVVVRSSRALTEGSIRLGQWMDWGQRLLHVLRHEHRVHLAVPEANARPGLALSRATARRSGARAAGPRISAHELVGELRGRTDPSLFVRLPLLDRPGESLAVWTTTPWTLPANVAAAVNPEAEYGRRANGEWWAVARDPDASSSSAPRAPSSSACATRARSTTCRRRAKSSTGSSPGTTSRWRRERASSISPRAAGAEDFELSRVHDLPVLMPVDEAGRFYDRLRLAPRPEHGRGGRADRRRPRRAREAHLGRGDRAPLPVLLALPHPPHLQDRGRLVHRRRRAAPEADRGERDGRVDARVLRQAHGGLAPEHGRLEHLAAPLLRPAAAVLPLRVRAPDRRRLEGRAHRAGDGGPRPAGGASPALDRRGHDPLRGLRERGRPPHPGGRGRLARRRHRPAIHARLGEPHVGRERIRDRRLGRALRRRPPRPRLLGDVVPRRLGLGDARADPPLVLLAALHVGRARRPIAVSLRARLREDARRARPGDAQLLGEHDRCAGCVCAHWRRRHALAVLRSAAGSEPALRLRAGERRSRGSCSRSGTRCASSSTTGTSKASAELRRPLLAPARRGLAPARPLARRPHGAVRRGGDPGPRGPAHAPADRELRRVRRRRLQLVHPPLAPALLGWGGCRAQSAVVCPRPGHPRNRAGDAVPGRAPMAGARRRRLRRGAGERLPRRLARGAGAGCRAPGGDPRGAGDRRPRAPRA